MTWRAFCYALMRRINLAATLQLLLRQYLHNQRRQQTAKDANEQLKQKSTNSQERSLPPLPDWRDEGRGNASIP